MKDYDYKKMYAAFMRDSLKGRRRLANGNRISKGTINNYLSTFNTIIAFEQYSGKILRLRNINNLGVREKNKESKYWIKFGDDLLAYMTRKGFLDNYIGFHFKNIKTFHNYLKTHRNIDTGPFNNILKVRKEEPPVIVLATERLKYLMHNAQFRSRLAPNLVSSLDMFIFGCCTGLRFSDLTRLRKNNLQFQNNSVYLIVRSKKTQVDTRIKLPEIALNSLKPYQNKQVTLFPKISLSQFNCNLKKLFELVGWTEECPKLRTRNGQLKAIKHVNGKNYRFCDLASSHLMRKTAITSMLLLGMPEPLVRKISGHAINSREFYRYVNYSQSFLDEHTDAVFEKFGN